jgi:hypothetical protein
MISRADAKCSMKLFAEAVMPHFQGKEVTPA